MNQLSIGMKELQEALSASPNDASLDALRGAYLSALGDHVAAADAFEASNHADWYLRAGSRFHADSLRALGRVAEAVEVRQVSVFQQNRTLQGDAGGIRSTIRDHLEARDFAEAEALLPVLLSADPNGHRTWAVQAELELLQGDIDAAAFDVFLGNLHSEGGLDLSLAEARIMLADDNIEALLPLLRRLTRKRASHVGLWALRAEVFRQMGEHAEALDILNAPRFASNTSMDLRAVHVRLLCDMKEWDEAEMRLDNLRADYALHVDLPALEQYVADSRAGVPPHPVSVGTR